MYTIAYAALPNPVAERTLARLEGIGYDLRRIQPDAQAALRVAALKADFVMVDLAGPPAMAPAVVASIREQSQLPMLLVSYPATPMALVAACIAAGADDVLCASADPVEVASRLATMGGIARDRKRTTRRFLDMEQELCELRRLSNVDPLTGLCNRRHLFSLLRGELKRARRYGFWLAVVMADVDHFKRVNDEHGHDVGDEALKHVASVLRAAVREEDVVGRYGGEEFCVVLPQTGLASGVRLAERARARLESQSLLLPGIRLSMTLSLGVSAYEGKGGSELSDLIKRADEALYRAKQTGRNRVCADGEPPEQDRTVSKLRCA